MIDLTAHRTMGLRDAVQADENIALTVVVHALALQVFYPAWGTWTPLQLRLSVTGLERLAPRVSDGPAGRRVADRLEAWGARLPEEARDLWVVLMTLPPSDLLDLMACCTGVGLYAVRDPHDRKPDALAHAETLATVTGLDMAGTWTATAASYFSRVSKARVLEAVPDRYGEPELQDINPDERIARIDAFFANCGADIRHGGGNAYYAPGPDHVQMPPFECFDDADAYYSTLGHEMTHWTRHPARLDRDFGRHRFGDPAYAREELVAELGAAFLCADLGLALEPREDHAAYIGQWLQVLKDDKRFIVSAASHAQKAVDYLHRLQPV